MLLILPVRSHCKPQHVRDACATGRV